jgi:hypothetical protein
LSEAKLEAEVRIHITHWLRRSLSCPKTIGFRHAEAFPIDFEPHIGFFSRTICSQLEEIWVLMHKHILDDYEDTSIDLQTIQEIQTERVSGYRADQIDYTSFDAVADDHFIADFHTDNLILKKSQAERSTLQLARRGRVNSND